jgi:glutathione synthase/RimK-type ligase-like ATP-grasp enzyme
MRAVLFKSEKRFDSFKKALLDQEIACIELDFNEEEWIHYDYTDIDFIIYFPTFKFSSNHPLALGEVYDNLIFLKEQYPNIKMFPDPHIIRYYNDKYRQYLFLKKNKFPIPDTIPLLSEALIHQASREFGFPLIIKNRYGAGGESVLKIRSEKELINFYNLSRLNLFNWHSFIFYLSKISKRRFYYHLIKDKKMEYPFFSYPLIAQRFIKMDRDLKTVIGDYTIVEAHWRRQTDQKMWKVNIDGGGIGEWSYVPSQAIDLSEQLARALKTRWLNIDLVLSEGKFLITEFSPVWHHYKYKEKPSFVYKNDYNITMPLEQSLDLERIIINSLIAAVKNEKQPINV